MKKPRVISNRDTNVRALTPNKEKNIIPDTTKKTIKEENKIPPKDTLDSEILEYNGPQGELLNQIEARFLEVADLKVNLSYRNVTEGAQVETDKEKSDKHGEVFTPLNLVDKMLDRITPHDWKKPALTTFDLCTGYGQFTVRMLRRRYHYLGEALGIAKVLSEYHLMAEIQPSSCFKLLYIFGSQIRLLIGDASKMGELPDTAEHGIWVYNKEKWEDRTNMIVFMYNKYYEGPNPITEKAEAFEKKFNSLKTLCEKKEK